jgi:hypothetical protein
MLAALNFRGVVYRSLIAAEHPKKRGGAIVNVGSVFSDRAAPVQSIYSASNMPSKDYRCVAHGTEGGRGAAHFRDARESRPHRYAVLRARAQQRRFYTKASEHPV